MGWLRMGVRWCSRGKIDAERVGQVGVAGRVQPHSPRAGLASYAAIVQEMLEQLQRPGVRPRAAGARSSRGMTALEAACFPSSRPSRHPDRRKTLLLKAWGTGPHGRL